MFDSQFIQEKAEKLVAEHRVLQVFWGAMFGIFLVVGRTKSYFVHLRKDDTFACTCADWERRHRICSHILASQLYQNPPPSERPNTPDPERLLDTIEYRVADAEALVIPQAG